MSDALKTIYGVLLGGALSLGCSDGSRAGCENNDVVLFDQQCLTSNQCPECDPICESRGGTRLSGPRCVQVIGFGFFCSCSCEICFEEDSME
jgi:hypothetical protein